MLTKKGLKWGSESKWWQIKSSLRDQGLDQLEGQRMDIWFFLPFFFFFLEARGNGRVQDLEWVTGVARNWRALSRGNQRTESTLVCISIDKLFMKVAGLEGEGRLGKLGLGLKCSESMQVWEAVNYNDEGRGKRRLGDTNLKFFYFLCLFLNLGVPEYALESALKIKEGSVLKRLWDDEQELQNGDLRAEQDFGWGKEVGEDSGRKLREFFFFLIIGGEKGRQCAKSDVPRIMVVPGSFWHGSGTTAWDTARALSHPGSPGSHEGKVDFCTSTCSGGRSGHQCVGWDLFAQGWSHTYTNL